MFRVAGSILRDKNSLLRRPGRDLYLPPMDPLLKLLASDASLSAPQLAALLGLTEEEVRARIKQAEQDRLVLGYRAVLNEEKLGRDLVRAIIEVRITPERGGGFDKLAERIARHDEVRSCHLMSGGYDLLVEVEGALFFSPPRTPTPPKDVMARPARPFRPTTGWQIHPVTVIRVVEGDRKSAG